MKRNRQQTEKRIVEAAITLLAEEGFNGFGVNAVASKAGVDKVLIYRYFSGLEGLLEFIGNTEVLFPSAVALLDGDLNGFFRNYARAMQTNSLTARLHKWERVADNPLTQAYRRQRLLFWEDAGRLLRPQSDAARSVIELLAASPLDEQLTSALAPLLSVTECLPVSAKHGDEAGERLADNLL